ncbi:MAG TPA: type II secretion system major pseudopilin GspG [Phycisphaerae bacterium]
MEENKELRMYRRQTRKAFTLIELLLVLVILAVLAAVVVPKLTGRVETARHGGTVADIANLKNALNTFEIDNGRLPNTAEGLEALVSCPTGFEASWHKLIDKVPVDKWGDPYIYICPGTQDPDGFDLRSMGPDKQDGTDDDINKNDN